MNMHLYGNLIDLEKRYLKILKQAGHCKSDVSGLL